jgi:hypothetical protein
MGSLLKSLKKFGFVLPKLLLQPKRDFSDYSLFQFAANFSFRHLIAKHGGDPHERVTDDLVRFG